MSRIIPVVGSYEDGSLTVSFYGYKVPDEAGDFIEDITIQDVHLLGTLIPDIKVLPEALQASLIALADDIETWMSRE